MLEYPPPPCVVDDTPYTSCCVPPAPYFVDAAGRIHPGRGGVIVIVQLPQRDAAAAAHALVVASPPAADAPAPPLPAPPTPRRPRMRP